MFLSFLAIVSLLFIFFCFLQVIKVARFTTTGKEKKHQISFLYFFILATSYSPVKKKRTVSHIYPGIMGVSALPAVSAFFSFAATLLLVFVLIGSIKNKVALRDINFLRLDMSRLSTDILPTLGEINDGGVRNLDQLKEVGVGLMGYCYSNGEETVRCSEPSTQYYLALDEIVWGVLRYRVQVNEPGTLAENVNTIYRLNHSMVILFILAAALSFVMFVLAVVATATNGRRVARVITALVSLLAFVVTFGVAALMTGLYVYVRNQYNNTDSSIPARLSAVGFGLAWAAVLASFVAFVVAVVSICFASKRGGSANRSSAYYEKEPFLEPGASSQQGGGNAADLYSVPTHYQEPPQQQQQHDMFAQHHGGYTAANEPQFVQPTYYDHAGTPRP